MLNTKLKLLNLFFFPFSLNYDNYGEDNKSPNLFFEGLLLANTIMERNPPSLPPLGDLKIN
jgi:hypothetical protein